MLQKYTISTKLSGQVFAVIDPVIIHESMDDVHFFQGWNQQSIQWKHVRSPVKKAVYTCICSISSESLSFCALVKHECLALTEQADNEQRWKGPALSPWRAPVAKELVIDPSMGGMRGRGQAGKHLCPASQCPIGQSCKSLSTLQPARVKKRAGGDLKSQEKGDFCYCWWN